MRRRETLAWLLATVWLFSAGAALGYFSFRDQRLFEPVRVSAFDAQQRERFAERWFRSHVAQTGMATVVYVARPGCACNRFTSRHLQRIGERYAASAVHFVNAQPDSSLPWIDAAPAALVFDGKGRLAYYGPFSDSAWCGSDSGRVEPVLDRLLRGEHMQPQAFYGAGCFCSGSAPQRRQT